MKKLLSVSPHMSTGGLPQVLVKRIELIKDDIDIYVIEFNNYSNDFIIQKNRIKKLLKPDHFFTLGDNKEEILDIIDKIQPDFIHMEEIPELFNISFDICTKIYKKDRKYKIFETTHSSDYQVDEKLFFPDKFLFVSQYNCFKFNKFGIPTEVIEYPVEKRKTSPERKAETMQKLGLDPKFKHVINVGLFTPRKNQAYAFEIARKLSNEKIKFHFIGNQADNFQDYWRPLLKIKPKNCILWGERDDVDDFLDACDLFLFTSRGFRWNKELNPLVIKEALQHELPQFMFPLDVYNRKYDTEDTVYYLNGDVDIDAAYVKNFLFEKNDVPWKNKDIIDKLRDLNFIRKEVGNEPSFKYKIRAVHLLLEEDDRKKDSIKELERLKEFGIDYVQHINKRYTDTPPRDFCARPYDVGRIGAYSLRGPHYGNYQSFRKAILTEFTDDIDFLMIFESDCKLTVSVEEFVDKVFQSCEHIMERRIFYMSFGDNRNLRTGEMVSDNQGFINEWMYLTNKIIGIQSIMFPKFAFPFIKRAYDTTLWDVSDLLFNDMFKFKTKAIAPRLTTQIEGISTIQGEKIEHFLLKDINYLLKNKNPEDIIIEYNKEDQKFHICLSDFYQKDISDFKIVVNADENKNIYTKDNIMLNSFSPIWIQIYSIEKYNEFSFDFYYKNYFLFTKSIKPNGILNSPIVKEEMKKIIVDEKKIEVERKERKEKIKKDDFELDFKINENKLYLPYNGDLKDIKLNVIVKNIETDDIIFTSNNLTFNNGGYCNWISPGTNYYTTQEDFCGFKVDYVFKEEYLFTKYIRLRDNIKTIDVKEIVEEEDEKVKTNKSFLVLTYPDIKIKEEITNKCIDNLSGNKIILASHFPVSKEIQEKVDYYIYDSYNPLISHTLYAYYWSTIPEGKVEIQLDKINKKANLNQSLTVFNNINNAIKFAKEIGIDKIISTSYDFIFNKENINTINNLCEKIDKENKNGYFMLYNEGDMKLYKSVFFIVKPEFYLKIFDKIIRTPEEYNKECSEIGAQNFLENLFYNKISKFKDDIIIEETDENKLFNNEEINLFSGVEYLTLLPVKNDTKSFIIWFNSSNHKDDRRILFIYDNNGIIEENVHFIKSKSYYFKKITLSEKDNYNITVNFIDSGNNNLIETYKFNINLNNYSDIINNGIFTEKNN